MSVLSDIFGQGSYWTISKPIAKHLESVEAALFYSELVDKENYFEQNNQLIDIDGKSFFYATSDNLESNTTLTYKLQRKCIKILIEKGFIETILKGVPAKTHFHLCSEAALNALEFSIAQRAKLVLPNGTNKNSPTGETSIAQKLKLELTKSQNYIEKLQRELKEEKLKREPPKGPKEKKGGVSDLENIKNLKDQEKKAPPVAPPPPLEELQIIYNCFKLAYENKFKSPYTTISPEEDLKNMALILEWYKGKRKDYDRAQRKSGLFSFFNFIMNVEDNFLIKRLNPKGVYSELKQFVALMENKKISNQKTTFTKYDNHQIADLIANDKATKESFIEAKIDGKIVFVTVEDAKTFNIKPLLR